MWARLLRGGLRRVGRRLPLVVGSEERRQLLLIQRSGMFSASDYRAQLPPWRRWLVWRPELHFLRRGWRHGLAPGPHFSTRWYLSRYSDVRRDGVNPLLHFLRHGAQEGRLPAPGIALSDLHFLHASPAWLERQLWHGHAARALPRLEALADEGDGAAHWFLASWHYGQGRAEQALRYLEAEDALAPSPFAALLEQARLKCWLRQGDDERLAAAELPASPLVAALVVASRVGLPAEARLEALNHWYQRHGLAPIRAQESSDALDLSGLTARRVLAKRRRQMPLVSVVVPAYNAESTLATALDGLLGQSWPNLEIIVVDDASEDGTAALVEAKARYQPRLRLVRHTENQGAYAARNTGMRAAQGAYLTVHDSDDWSHPQKIERQVAALLDSPEAKGVLSHWLRVDVDFRCLGPWHLTGEWFEINPSSLMVPRAVVESLGDWDPVKVAGDNEFIDRLIRHYGEAAILKVLPEVPLAFSLVQPGSLTQQSATHVRTVRGGVRHLYHQAARWWHRRHPWPYRDGRSARRAFPAPLGNLRDPRRCFDLALVANLSARNTAGPRLLEAILGWRQAGLSVVLVPWTTADDFSSGEISDAIWELCHEEDIALAHPGVELQCERLLTQLPSPDPLEWPDRVPVLSLSLAPESLDGQPLPADVGEALCAYLQKGGRSI